MSANTTDLGKDSVGKLLFKLAVPAIIAQLVNVLYNIIDRIFIGRLPDGEVAIAGVGVAFPVIILIAAFAGLFGMGGAPLAAIKMGEGKEKEAEKIMTTSFSMLVLTGIVLTTVFLIFKEPILWAFGASAETMPAATDYVTFYLMGTVAVMVALGMNPFINTQGFAKIGMLTVIVGAVINIVLDPIFIFGLNMGVKGAALATILAQFVSAIWVLYFFLGKEKTFKNKVVASLFGQKSKLKLQKHAMKPDRKITFAIMSLGISPFVMQSTESLILIVINRQLAHYGGIISPQTGDLAIGAMTIMGSVMQIVILPLLGLSQGAQPIISYNYGAKNDERVKKTFKILVSIAVAYTITMWVALMCVPEMFVKLFNKDSQELITMTTWSIRLYFGGIILYGAQIACQQTFLALGQAKISLFLALLRKIILLIPLTYILPLFLQNQLAGVFIAETVADLLATITTIMCFTVFYKRTFGKKTSGL